MSGLLDRDEWRRRIEPLERVVNAVAASLPQPMFVVGDNYAGFRYGRPDSRHFCLLKLVRSISALNAMQLLASQGYTQEVGVLVRVLNECVTQIEFVLINPNNGKQISAAAEQLVADFFADHERGGGLSSHKKSKLQQSAIQRSLGAAQDELISELGDERFAALESAALYRQVSATFSAYVHCKYPETMDLFGGRKGEEFFHLRGMAGTPKDLESASILTTFTHSVDLCAKLIIVRLALTHLVDADPIIGNWYRMTS